MSSKNIAVFGIYRTPDLAERAVDHLLTLGFTNSAISILLQDDKSTRDFAHEKNTKAPEGTAAGVTAGGIIGGTLGLLAGLGALAIPGIGPLIA
ncbi:MAG: general stress protein, partial [Edaphobacter sp.]